MQQGKIGDPHFAFKSPFSVAMSTGTDTCSCAISQWPSIFLYPSVARTVTSVLLPSLSVKETC